jgi:hypothetical protein
MNLNNIKKIIINNIFMMIREKNQSQNKKNLQ